MTRKELNIISILVALLFSVGGLLLAVEDQFLVNFTVSNGPDTTPPSIPAGLTATAISTTQINLSWTASTDNVSVLEYRVFRDGSHIATTSAITYLDPGLTQNTTYAYNIQALDAANNYSQWSATTTATTFAVSSTETPFGSVLPLSITSPVIVAGTDSAQVIFTTNREAVASISWGRSGEYEEGILTENVPLNVHRTRLEGLLSGTRYFVRIEVRDANGLVLVQRYEFDTEAGVDTTPPANVSSVGVGVEGNEVSLSWTNPEEDFDVVRILRGSAFYPQDSQDGILVYEGREEDFRETLEEGVHYYTLFARDSAGNYSSGAVVRVVVGAFVEEEPEVPESELDLDVRNLSLLQFKFIQDSRPISFVGNQIRIRGDKNLTIRIPYDAVPEVLKTITVRMIDPRDGSKAFSFLLKSDKEFGYYTATLSPLGVEGTSPFHISVFDYKNRYLKKLAGDFLVRLPLPQNDPVDGGISENILFGIVILILVLLALLTRRLILR